MQWSGTKGEKGGAVSADYDDYDQDDPDSWYQPDWDQQEDPGEGDAYQETKEHYEYDQEWDYDG
eukprot:7313967-Prorocentrum_lima.AAC.1